MRRQMVMIAAVSGILAAGLRAESVEGQPSPASKMSPAAEYLKATKEIRETARKRERAALEALRRMRDGGVPVPEAKATAMQALESMPTEELTRLAEQIKEQWQAGKRGLMLLEAVRKQMASRRGDRGDRPSPEEREMRRRQGEVDEETDEIEDAGPRPRRHEEAGEEGSPRRQDREDAGEEGGRRRRERDEDDEDEGGSWRRGRGGDAEGGEG